MTGPRTGAEYPYVMVGLPGTNACRPAATLSVKALLLLAASKSSGSGKGVLNQADSLNAGRSLAKLTDTAAAAPTENCRRVNMAALRTSVEEFDAFHSLESRCHRSLSAARNIVTECGKHRFLADLGLGILALARRLS